MTTDTQAGIDRIRSALLVSRARERARSGDRQGALALLTAPYEPGQDASVPKRRMPLEVLDLLARLHAQNGAYEQAASFWQQVLERNPANPAAAAGLARIERLRRGGAARALARHRVACLAAMAAAVITVAAITVPLLADDGASPVTPHTGTVSIAEQLRTQQQEVQESVRRSAATAARAARAAEQARLTDLAHALRAPGIRASAGGRSVDVVFADGLFVSGDRLTVRGAQQLAQVGKA
ncbi:MAG: hypothetical protein LBV60_18565, partial [Streptomyces sp.]|nr:hypothetical protein [Streptomyces sp.]